MISYEQREKGKAFEQIADWLNKKMVSICSWKEVQRQSYSFNRKEEKTER